MRRRDTGKRAWPPVVLRSSILFLKGAQPCSYRTSESIYVLGTTSQFRGVISWAERFWALLCPPAAWPKAVRKDRREKARLTFITTSVRLRGPVRTQEAGVRSGRRKSRLEKWTGTALQPGLVSLDRFRFRTTRSVAEGWLEATTSTRRASAPTIPEGLAFSPRFPCTISMEP